MKLESPSRSTSFYESFSDLIFGTMAIFVLLMLVFLALVQPPATNQDTEEMLAQAEAQLEEQKEDINQLQAQLKKSEFQTNVVRKQLEEMMKAMAESENSVHSKGLELIVAFDVSGSMDNALAHLFETIKTISIVLPTIAPEYRLGMIGYAYDDNGKLPDGLQIFPIRNIFPEQKDSGRSISSINNFLTNVIRGRIAPTDRALLKAMEMSSQPKEFDGFQVIMLLGDAGPYEYGELNILEENEIQSGKAVTERVKNWASASDNRRIISYYSAERPQYNYHPVIKAGYEFFKELPKAAGQPENFIEDTGKMLAKLLEAIVKKE